MIDIDAMRQSSFFRLLQITLAGIVLLTGLPTPFAHADAPVESLPLPPPIRDVRFGAVEAYDAPNVATSAGVGWTRIIFWWHQVQPGGPHDWNAFYFPDGMVNQELAAGREMVGIIAGTPAWASESGSVRAVPSGLYLPYDDPDNLWGQFVYRIAQRYKGQIDRWIIWNEPDVWDPDHPGFTWDGTVEDYVQLLKVARRAAKAANPDAKIHLTATTYWWDAQYGREQYFKRLLDAIVADPEAAAEDGFFDVASVHIYFSPQQVWDVTRYFRSELEKHGLGHKPLWINETNAPPSSDPSHPAPGLRFPISLEQQANFVMQAWALGIAAGAERISLYKTRDERNLPVGVEPYGMMRTDGSLRPVFWAYRALVTYLGQYTGAQLFSEGPVRRVVVQRGNLGQTTVVWNMGTTPRLVAIPASAGQALLVDELGPIEILTAQGGSYSLTLPPASGEIGGTTYMLVEGPGADIRIPRSDGPPLALPTATGDTPPVTVTTPVTATGTVTVTLTPVVQPTATFTPTADVPPTVVAGETALPTTTVPPSATPTRTPTPAATRTSTPLPTAVETAMPVATATASATSSPLSTPTTESEPSATSVPVPSSAEPGSKPAIPLAVLGLIGVFGLGTAGWVVRQRRRSR